MKKVNSPNTNESGAAVEVRLASKTYSDGTKALLPVDLVVNQGEFLSLLGPSGCGKSTLLKMIAGLISPNTGDIQLKDSRGMLEGGHGTNPRLSFVFQSPTLMPWANLRTNVRLPLDLAGISKDVGNARVDEVLDKVGLSDFANSLPRSLSGGMQMRASIARGLVTQPNILLMDEPFGALDEITRHKLDADLLDLWQKQNLTIIFVTHSIHEAVYLSNRVIMMAARPGRITEEIKIDQPYPRSPDFMMTQEFMQYALVLQRSLQNASNLNFN